MSSKQRVARDRQYALYENPQAAPSRAVPSGFFNNFSHYKFVLGSMFSCIVLLSVLDLATTSIALSQGLREGNVILLGIASWMRLGFYQTIIATKVGFILGAGALVFLGIKSELQMTRKIVLSSLIGFVLMLFFVSVNNLILILH